jgi:hypothetical protein
MNSHTIDLSCKNHPSPTMLGTCQYHQQDISSQPPWFRNLDPHSKLGESMALKVKATCNGVKRETNQYLQVRNK